MIKTVFDDNDLKRLKDHEGYWRDDYDMRKLNPQISASWGWVDGLKIDALLARLEAAERGVFSLETVIRWMREEERYKKLSADDLVWLDSAEITLEAWRKAADK